jgi:hypothetical protein
VTILYRDFAESGLVYYRRPVDVPQIDVYYTVVHDGRTVRMDAPYRLTL